ncbi:MAG: DUF4129 domain-containing protein [Flavisolibacter sp.]
MKNHIIFFTFFIFFVLTWFPGRTQGVEPPDSAVSTSIYFDSIGSQQEKISAQKIPDTVLNKIRKDEAYWYANLAPQRKKKVEAQPQKYNSLDRPYLRSLLWFLIIAGLVAVVVWYLASSNIHLFRRPSTVIVSEEEGLSSEDIFELDYEKEIHKAISSGNFRLAIRLLYLSTLKQLETSGLIEFKPEKTNQDYIRELSGGNYYKDFFRLTRDFEYVWYGQFPLSAESFARVQKDFFDFKQGLSS